MNRMHGGFTTCTEMYGNGQRRVIFRILTRTRMDETTPVLSKWSVWRGAVPGATARAALQPPFGYPIVRTNVYSM